MTAISGLAQNYWQLLAARVGVGIGEAAVVASHSMISIFSRPRNARAPLGLLYGHQHWDTVWLLVWRLVERVFRMA